MDRLLLVYSRPVEGREQEYHDWYDRTHLRDVVAVPGVRAARRYQAADAVDEFLAVYELDGDPADVLAELSARFGTDAMVASDAIDVAGISMTAWTPRGERVEQAPDGE